MHAMTQRTPPPAQDAPEEADSTPTPIALWMPDGQLCVAIVDLPPPHVPDGRCRCGACGFREPVSGRADV